MAREMRARETPAVLISERSLDGFAFIEGQPQLRSVSVMEDRKSPPCLAPSTALRASSLGRDKGGATSGVLAEERVCQPPEETKKRDEAIQALPVVFRIQNKNRRLFLVSSLCPKIAGLSRR